MDQTLYGVVIGGVIGIVGYLTALVGNMASSKAETKRHLHKLGFELGIKEWEDHMSRADLSSHKYMINPPLHYVYFNYRVLEEISKGKLTPDMYGKICIEREALLQAILKDDPPLSANERRDR